MNAPFNPYREWLGLEVSAPDYYTLLGVDPKATTETIQASADRVAARIRSVRPGPQAKAWAALLDEVAEAKACLLSPPARENYDQTLGDGGSPRREGPSETAEPAKSILTAETVEQHRHEPLRSGPSQAFMLPPPRHESSPPNPNKDAEPTGGDRVPYLQPISEPPADELEDDAFFRPESNLDPMAPLADETLPLPADVSDENVVPSPLPLPSASSSPTPAPSFLAPPAAEIESAAQDDGEMSPSSRFVPVAIGVLISFIALLLVLVFQGPDRAELVTNVAPPSTTDGTAASNTVTTLDDAPSEAPESAVEAELESENPAAAGQEDPPPTPQTEPDSAIKEEDFTRTTPLPTATSMPTPGLPTNFEPDRLPTMIEDDAPDVASSSEPIPDMPTPDRPMRDQALPTAAPMTAAPMTAARVPISGEPLTQAEQVALLAGLKSARAAITARDWSEVAKQLEGAQLLLRDEEHLGKWQRLQTLARLAEEFDNAVAQSLQKLTPGDEIAITESTRVTVEERTEARLVVQVAGLQRDYRLDALPAGITIALAANTIGRDNPRLELLKGVYWVSRTTESPGDARRIREIWQDAANVLPEVQRLLPILEDRYE